MRSADIVFLLLLSSASLWAIAPESVVLNTRAMSHYENKNWSQAIALFEQAIALDPTNYLAHYNLACTLALAKEADPSAASWAKIGFHLKQSLVLNQGRLAKMRLDPDLRAFRKTFYFQQAFGQGLLAGSNLTQFLRGNRLKAVLERGQTTIQGTAVFSLEKGLTIDFPDIGMRFSGMWSTKNGEVQWTTPGRPAMYAYYSGLSLVFPLTPWGKMHLLDLHS